MVFFNLKYIYRGVMKLRIEIWSIVIGIGIGVFATDIAGNFFQNYYISSFLGQAEISFSMLKPQRYLDWPSKDVRGDLSLKADGSGRKSCVHVTPISPEYLVTSELEDGTKICCSLGGKSTVVPIKEDKDSIEFFCGEYPDQQVVRVSKNAN
ncbi:hypothetical protein BCT46_14825 [Vibrio sp. 10N.261.46.E8]|nr:hypothetical protein BH584_15275 [Vibrio sp. 10N.261.45.E1]PMJ27832.1 hypothetical protein BCU27_06480 [Vibrio sp. 10N.286.45.B6]PML88109.1 hypothetical protein BCT66_10960 [Vibrio sp. 10N.261.49.E11]PMM67437.1 hypothetical protein BCT48_15435 [Vibrio sp. 10N.261.46.F12]PMM81680.1 hypothetical protein BCT46_14825 [Vibrio sp. 10N.261.46.E8]PMN91908.1 hypothetical protein BCT25_00775 [Vibrio sp. 10N.261.45.A6]